MTLHHHPAVPQPVKLTSDDFLLLDRSGAFVDHGKVELIEGTIVAMNAAFSRHAAMQRTLFRALDEACRHGPPGLEVFFELTVTLPPRNVVVPDIVVARDLPADGPLTIAGLLLAVEVAATTLDFDMGAKAAIYARENVPEYWVADIAGGRLHQLWTPGPDGYAQRRHHPLIGHVDAATLPIGIGLPAA